MIFLGGREKKIHYEKENPKQKNEGGARISPLVKRGGIKHIVFYERKSDKWIKSRDS